MESIKVTVRDIRQAVRDLDVAGQVLCVHSSLRSFGWVEGGAMAVIDGLLAEGCTMLVPTYSSMFAVPPPPDKRPARNGWNYEQYAGPTSGIGRVYTPESVEIDKGMGAIPAIVLAKIGRVRGNHPLSSFSAVGPLAEEIISGQGPMSVYAPLEKLVKVNGSVVLMGVGLDRMTLLHLAEQRAGRNLFRRWANGPDEQPMEVQVGSCSDGFHNFEPALASVMKEIKVGQSLWKVFPAKGGLEVAEKAIRQDAWLTHCDNAECERCGDAMMGGPILSAMAGA